MNLQLKLNAIHKFYTSSNTYIHLLKYFGYFGYAFSSQWQLQCIPELFRHNQLRICQFADSMWAKW